MTVSSGQLNVLERVELKISSIEVLLYQAYHVYKLAIRTKMSVIRKKTAVSSKDTYTIRAMAPYHTPDKVTLTGINIKKCGFNRICQEKCQKYRKYVRSIHRFIILEAQFTF